MKTLCMMSTEKKIFFFWNLIRSGYFFVLSGCVYAVYRTAVCLQMPSLAARAELLQMPVLVETLVLSAVIMTAGGWLGTYLLRRYEGS